jgi:sulfur-carrier protein
MKVTVKLFATFRLGRFTVEERDYPSATTVATIVAELGIPEQELGIILVNSRHVGLDRQLAEGDVLAIFPLLGGG